MLKRSMMLVTLVFLFGCQQPHLEIFPPLDDPNLTNKLLTVSEMSEDIDAFIYGALQRHPNMSKYTNIDDLFLKADELKKQLNKPMKRTEFYKIIGQLNAKLKDGHAFLIWPYQEYEKLKKTDNKPFPFAVKLTTDNKLVLANTYLSGKLVLKEGSVIQTINSISTNSLMNELQKYVGGETKILREQIVAERLPIMLWAVKGFINNFDLMIDNECYEISKYQEWLSNSSSEEEHSYQKLTNNTGMLYIEHFDIEPEKFEEFIDNSFKQISRDNINNLIIDVRNNPGGNTDTVSYLVSYLANKPFRLVSSVKEKLNQNNRGLFNYKGDIGEVVSHEWDDWEEPINSKYLFNGDVYILIGPITYSSAIVFATTIQDNKLGTLVGMPTGGFASQSAQGNLFNLPNSKLRAYITTRLLVRPNGEDNQTPVFPEYIVDDTTAYYSTGKDLAIEKVYELINEKRVMTGVTIEN